LEQVKEILAKGFPSFRLFHLLAFVFISLTTLQAEPIADSNSKDGITITVAKGQTLSVISKTYLDDPRKWKELLKSNKIDNPNLILPGMKLWIPASLGKRPIAEILKTRGDSAVFLHSKKESSWSTATTGVGMFLRDEAKTEADSIMELLLVSGSQLELAPNSHLLIERVKTESEPDTFFLRKGRLKAIVSKANGYTLKKMFILHTPAAIADVKGTEFLTEVDEKENTSLACYEGKVAVSAQNVTVEVNPGFATFVEKGKPPMTPFLIPQAPKIDP
jgi:hypothetical protein